MKRLLAIVAILLLVGIVSADTTILYPTSDDAPYMYGYFSTYATMRGSATGDYLLSATDGADPAFMETTSSSTTNYYVDMVRYFAGFNLTTINTSMTISGAKFGVYGTAKDSTWAAAPALELANASPANYASIAKADFNDINFVQMASNISYNSYSASSWNNFTLNSNGLAYLTARRGTNATLALTDSWDMFNAPPTWASSKVYHMKWDSVDHTGTAQDPFLEITWTMGGSPAAPVASFTVDRTMLRIPKTLTCTDTSTNTPTSWAWSWGDGTANSTTQNPTHTYTKRGMYTINMAATNAGGTGVATASTVRIVGYDNIWG